MTILIPSPATLTMPKDPRKATQKPARSVESETPAVYFRSIEVENVLCFKDKQILDLSTPEGLPAQWTVILGDNGVGKTTLLRCLAGMELKQVFRRFSDLTSQSDIKHKKFDRFYEPLIVQSLEHMSSWIRKLELSIDSDLVELTAVISYPVKIQEFKDSLCREGKIEVFIPDHLEITPDIEENSEMAKQLICYGYGAIRNLGKTSLSDTLTAENSLGLFVEGAELIDAEEWLLQADYTRQYSTENHGSRLFDQLTQIIAILKEILPDVEDVKIELVEEEDELRPRPKFKTPYGWVQIDDLGLGYRTAIAWMVDLAVRMFRRYPNSPDPLAEPAIVLVDEIDLHLHPRWQRTIMSFLSERFPNTQFIVTAHSPLVVQAAKDANIVLLRREGDRVIIDNNPAIIENWRIDQVLTSVFELDSDRPPQIEPLLKRREEILSQAHLTEADEDELKSLAQQIGSLPTADTPKDIEAMDIIRRAAKLLENA
jgi:hypothetical protein